MNLPFIIEVFTLLFATMGPIKVLIVFAEMTSEIDSGIRRKVALKAVGIAAVVGVIFIVFGQFLMNLFKVDFPHILLMY